MRVIPVLDIRRGIAVHVRRGERETYWPVQSCLTASADPLALLAKLARRVAGVSLLVDAGVRSPEDARRLLDIGAAGALVATAIHRGTISGGHLALLSGGAGHGRDQAGSW